MEKYNLLRDQQHGYRKCSSINTAIQQMIDVIDAENNHQKVSMICCDLSKAFDTVCHETVSQKLIFFAIRKV